MRSGFDGPYPTREAVTRDRIMDACIRGIAAHGLKGLKLKHIIEAAGVSKQTVYNHYRNLDAIVLGAFTREGTRISLACAEEIRRYDALEDKFVKGFLFIYENLPNNPVLNQIVLNHKEFLDFIGISQYPMQQFGRLCFGDVLREHPQLAASFNEVAELWSRSVLSFLLFEGETRKSREELEGFVRRRLVPGLGLSD